MIFQFGAARRFMVSFSTVLAAVVLCGAVWAQGHAGHSATADDALLDRWRRANESVGQFPRGHADLLRWEQSNLPKGSQSPAPAGHGRLGRSTAIDLALRDAPALLERPGQSRLEQEEVRRKVRAQSLEVERAWVDAVVSAQALEQARQILETAEIGAELAQRMLAVGHWSRARQMQEELPLWQARARLAQSQWTHTQALQRLWQQVGASLTWTELLEQLPAQWAEPLPQAPADPDKLMLQALQAHPRWNLEDEQARRQLAAVGSNHSQAGRALLEQAIGARAEGQSPRIDARMGLTHAQLEALQTQSSADRLKRQIQADVRSAHEAFKMAAEQAQVSQSELVRLARASEQETLWRYNGMLASTWQLLASARHRIEAVDAALQARRQAWHAYFDLQAVLAGLPYTGAASTPSTSTPSASKAGH
jgi:hypothetical protein